MTASRPRLLIVSHTPHYCEAGVVVGWGATVRELDYLATLFDEVVHLAPLHDEPAPPSSRAYSAKNIRLEALVPAGGPRLRDKFSIVGGAPAFFGAMRRLARWADAVHVRAPANVALLAMVAGRILSGPRPWWIKYAGNWRPLGPEAWSYRLQRAWLSHPPRHPPSRTRGSAPLWAVTVNGSFPGDGAHVRSFINPCLDAADLVRGRQAADAKKSPAEGVELLFVGRTDVPKGTGRALRVLSQLPDAHLHIAGDGPERADFERMAESLGIASRVDFHGWLPRARLDALYSRAHVIVLPSVSSEGWPKVLSEAMAHGVLPVTSDISSMPQFLDRLGVGRACDPHDIDGLAATIVDLTHPENFGAHSLRACQAAESFTYDRYLGDVRQLFQETWNLHLEP